MTGVQTCALPIYDLRHSYDEPEIVATAIVSGSASFLSWIRDETRTRPASGASGTPATPRESSADEAARQAAEGQIRAE